MYLSSIWVFVFLKNTFYWYILKTYSSSPTCKSSIPTHPHSYDKKNSGYCKTMRYRRTLKYERRKQAWWPWGLRETWQVPPGFPRCFIGSRQDTTENITWDCQHAQAKKKKKLKEKTILLIYIKKNRQNITSVCQYLPHSSQIPTEKSY